MLSKECPEEFQLECELRRQENINGNSLEDQTRALEAYGCQEIITEAFSGYSRVILWSSPSRIGSQERS